MGVCQFKRYKMLAPLLCYLIATNMVLAEDSFRLPDTFWPIEYNLTVLTNLANMNENYTFDGTISILLKCWVPSNTIILHSRNLSISESGVTLHDDTGMTYKIVQHEYRPTVDFYIIHVEKTLTTRSMYTLYIPFQGVLTEGLAGYYRSSYVDAASKRRWLGVTQFSPIDARAAFPCFDEPKFKAVFHIQLGRINTLKSLSNGQIMRQEPIEGMEGWTWDIYSPTLKQSTYLIAYIVTDYVFQETTLNNITINLHTREEALDQTRFALEISPKLLNFCENYFNIPFMLPKIDIATVPDFHYSAMENWGLMTFVEKALLYDNESSSISTLERIADVVGHELAHQWFGNLVTPMWWTDLWLKEGFATYISNKAVFSIFPEWNSFNKNGVEQFMTVAALDALNSSHPVSVPLDDIKLIGQIFDAISYKKGSFILRMLNNILGENNFRKGIQLYLNKFKFSNAEKDDLWDCFLNVKRDILPDGIDVKTVMDSWTLQTGYPVVTVSRNKTSSSLVVSQKRFMLLDTNSTDHSCWFTFLKHKTQRRPTVNADWIICADEFQVDLDLEEDEWYLMNLDLTSLVRINYDQQNWQFLAEALKNNYNDIDILSRVQIIDDLFNLARANFVSYETVVNIIEYLKVESEYLPWWAASEGLDYLRNRLVFDNKYGEWKGFVQSLITNIYKKLMNQNIPEIPTMLETIMFKTNIFTIACEHELKESVQFAVDLFQEWKSVNDPDKNNPIPKDLHYIVSFVGIRTGNQSDWDFLWARLINNKVDSERVDLLKALGASKDQIILQNYLERSLNTSSDLRVYEGSTVFQAIVEQPSGFHLATRFFIDRFDDFYNYNSLKLLRLSNYINSLPVLISTTNEVRQLEDFFNEQKDRLSGNQQAVTQCLENARINAAWNQKYVASFYSFLK